MSAVRMLRLIEVAKRHDPDLHVWLANGIDRWRDGELLDRALDLNGRGAKLAADDALLRAAEILDPEGTYSPWILARKLADVLQHFKSNLWPRARLSNAPDGLTDMERELWVALKSSDGVRSSARRIFDLLTERGRFCQLQRRRDNFLQSFLTGYRPTNESTITVIEEETTNENQSTP